MKKFLRGIAVLTLGLYIGLVVSETCHTLWGHHTETNCAICQVAHQTPVISQGKPVLHNPQQVRHFIPQAQPVLVATSKTTYSGLSPPVL